MSTKTNRPRKIKNLDNDRRAQNRKAQYFLKKGYQLSKLCGSDVLIMTFDRKLKKLNEYFSSPDF